MSQRLFVGSRDDKGFYDCVLSSRKGACKKLVDEWFQGSIGPFKIRIEDVKLFREIESILANCLESIGREYPEDIWVFYCGDRSIDHPTREQLDKWLSESEQGK